MTEKMANPGPAGEETRRKVIWIEVGVTDSFVVAIANNKIRPPPPPVRVRVTWHGGDLPEQSEEQLQGRRLVLAGTV